MGCEFIFTCQGDSEQLCLNEMRKIAKDVMLLKWLDAGVGLAVCGREFSEISEIFREEKPVFLRHIFPAEIIFDCADGLEEFDALINGYRGKINKNTAVSVQVRNKTGEKTYDLREIKSYMSSRLENEGCLYDKANPEAIISVFISGGKIYAGMSKGEDNLSIWPGGMRRYAFDDRVISRAEFKLLELFEYFPDLLDLSEQPQNQKNALDMGASPGGWTKILTQKGYKVTAVDPNRLADVLLSDPNVEYHKGLAEDFINGKNKKRPAGLFDLIVNDMRMHVVQSARIMIKAWECLKENGYAVMTLKLGKSSKTAAMRAGLNILKEKYDILFVKQLFHNRLEVTAVLRKKIF